MESADFMKAKELAEILLQYPELEVVVAGYEENLNPIETIIITKVKQDAKNQDSDIYGKLDYLGIGKSFKQNQSPALAAVYLGRGDRVGMSIGRVRGKRVRAPLQPDS